MSASAQDLQDELIARAWTRFESMAPRAIQDQLRAVPELFSVVEAGMNLGIAVAFEKATAEDSKYATAYKALMMDLHDLVMFARRTNKRVLSLRAIERLLMKHRPS